ncbi:hypothetical protein KUF71_009613 [Frankliniella fusca]|uniref:Uncharacterized protein n=1 Tax=Frankliniella fusca TaxID=407009 RepID=A0AAE1HGN3_9NEOP|nr:hypothetical protein KUF71_009613 [Frankliniella fusca]
MIKHGSGMALCLKFVKNKVPAAVPLLVRQRQPPVSVCSRHFSRHPAPSLLLHQANGRSEIPSSGVRTDHYTSGSTNFEVHCDSDVIRYISYLIFDCEETCTRSKRLLSPSCQCTSYYGLSYNASLINFKPSVLGIDPRYSHFLNTKGTGACNSIFNSSNLSKSKLQDLHLCQQSSNSKAKSEDPFQPPSEGQLNKIVETLSTDLPNFFIRPLNIKIYHQNIIFEDNIRRKKFIGRSQYSLQAKLLYVIGHLRFLSIRLDVLKITAHPEDGTVKVRWQINVIRHIKILKIKFWDLTKSIPENEQTWIDGFSTYYVKGDGLVHKHVADKMIPDPHQLLKKSEAAKTPAVPQPLAYSDRNKL